MPPEPLPALATIRISATTTATPMAIPSHLFQVQPPRFIPLEIGADYVLGRSRNADDVLRAAMYRLEKPR